MILSIEKINEAIKQLNQQNEKITQTNIIRLSSLSRSTVQRYWKKASSKGKKASPETEKVKAVDEKVKPENKKVQPSKDSSDAFKHFLKRKVLA